MGCLDKADELVLETWVGWVVGLGEMPRKPDAAFLAWVRKYTKGRRA